MSRCRSCHAPVLWAITEAGRRMPVDADPADPRAALGVADGNLSFVGSTPEGVPIVAVVPVGPGQYRSHFASCPDAARHRK